MFTLNCKGRLLVAEHPLVMGIINTTPGSFYSGSREMAIDSVLAKAEQMLAEGAAILDIGGQSTRPGSDPVNSHEESARVIPAIHAVHQRFPDAFISVDTYHASVAAEAVNAGACIINDISGGRLDETMLTVAGKLDVPFVCTHSRGMPKNMKEHAQYNDVVKEVLDYFIIRVEECRAAGIIDIIIDPGFGFAKTAAHNFQLAHDLSALTILDVPVLCGFSRKATIYNTLGITAEDALNGTTVMNTICLLNGAGILRVHDVKAAREAVLLINGYNAANQ